MPELRDLKVSEYDLATLEGIVCDITKAIKNKKSDYLGIGIAVADCEVADMVTALLSTGLFVPDYLDYTDNNYRGEYYIFVDSDGYLSLEKAWCEERCEYIPIDYTINNYVFVSSSISQKYFDTIHDDMNFIILYDLENISQPQSH